ncbi:hypothetical protein EDD16DRAFT_74898 [Pisolithus croceorrhizus]|nr:hypothetical protein EDD16DRAFT_74898 [Pisolithus croceorrhizus]
MGNPQVEFYQTSGGDSDVRGELGDRGNKGNGALNPEIFAKRCDTACLPRNRGIFGCARATATKSIPFERYRQVGLESQFTRGTDQRLSRYRVGEVGDDRGTWLPNTRTGGTWRMIYSRTCMKAEVCGCGCATFSSGLTHEYYEMTEYCRRQRLLSSRPAGWWAGLEWAHPLNFLANASMQVAVQVVASRCSTDSHGGSCGNQGCMAYLNMSKNVGL